MKRHWVPAVPIILSLILSATTVGPHLYWQDSGFFLVAIRELGILYPTGFALYLMICKAWTLALFFVDFTLAVHLFSSLCGALAAGALAQAARELLRSRGPLFHSADEGAREDSIDLAAAATGCLAACGYTFWSAALLAKVYAFYYLVLALLLWRMIRADATGSKRDFTIVAVLIGLAWQAHPSATTTGAALLLFVVAHRRTLGWRAIAGRMGIAAAGAIGPLLLLPILAAREPFLMFGDPRTAGGFRDYLLGSRFTQVPGVFGFAESRTTSVGLFLWEEALGVGVALMLVGLARLARINKRLLLGLAAWVAPVLLVTVLFKMEGQHDFWFVAAWLPLWLAAAVGLREIGRLARGRALPAIGAVAIAGTLWPILANHADLNVRNYTLPETMGHLYLDRLDEGAILILRSDNPLAACLYLQRLRAVRRDVAVVSISELLDEGGIARLIRRHPFLRAPEPSPSRRNAMLAAFADANGAVPGHPMFFEVPPPGPLLRSDFALVAAGTMHKLVARGKEHQIDPNYWHEPVPSTMLAQHQRRERAQFNEYRGDSVRVRPESYEHRFLRDLLRAQKNLADHIARSGTPEAFRESATIYESLLRLDPWMKEDPGAVYPLAGAYFGMKRYDLAEPWLKKALELDLPPEAVAQACGFLAVICRAGNRPDEAARWEMRAKSLK